MKKFLLIVLIAGLASCNDTTKIENGVDTLNIKIDTLANRIENSKIVDSLKVKGDRMLDSTKRKGDRLVNRLEERFRNLKTKKDSTK
jgi:hypothetical protein